MKRTWALVLVLLLTISLLTACGGGGSGNGNNTPGSTPGGGTKSASDISKADKELAKDAVDATGIGSKEQREQAKEFIDALSGDWPSDKLPDGMPVYPDGKVKMSMTVSDGFSEVIVIEGTNGDSFKNYVEILKNDGWTFSSDSTAAKEGWKLRIVNDKSEVRIAVYPPQK